MANNPEEARCIYHFPKQLHFHTVDSDYIMYLIH